MRAGDARGRIRKMKRILPLVAAAAFLASCQNMPPKDFTVHTKPEGARISINGKDVGTSPVTTRVEQTGDLAIVAQKPGYELAATSIATKQGKLRSFLWTEWSSKAQYIEEDEVTLPLRRMEAPQDYKPAELPPFRMPR